MRALLLSLVVPGTTTIFHCHTISSTSLSLTTLSPNVLTNNNPMSEEAWIQLPRKEVAINDLRDCGRLTLVKQRDFFASMVTLN
jgi:hypothetical protein